jgi:2,3-bisphosphoglycerate-dependent phosphoglycerate mutase
MSTLILLRHGQAQWNLENRFTGWTDVPLTERGKQDATIVGAALQDYTCTIAFTSRLQRANETLDTVLSSSHQGSVEIIADSALNERHYGDLQGLNKAETAAKHGEEQVQLWRRSYSTRPPNGESMEDCEHRTLPFYKQYIAPELTGDAVVLVVAHGNSLRPIMKYIENLSPETAATLEIGLCTPYIYTFTDGIVTHKEIREVEGIVTKGSSLKETSVSEGRV